jgi:hypothetical protein
MGDICNDEHASAPRRKVLIDLTGQAFGKLRIMARAANDKSGNARWLCKCSCPSGTETIVAGRDLRNGGTKSCGCHKRLITAARNTTHGHAIRGRESRTYKAWVNMLQRCSNPRNTAWENYGERGIAVCPRWESFENFLDDMGKCPAGLTIERRENNSGYSPQNCYWGTAREQARNRRNNRWIEFRGERMVVADWCERTGLKPSTLQSRLNRGWSAERALATLTRAAS